jgi:hypothetical protein
MARGKTKGATSHVYVSLRELNRILREDATVLVSRKFADAIQLESKKVEADYDTYSFVNNQVDVVKEMDMDAVPAPEALDF